MSLDLLNVQAQYDLQTGNDRRVDKEEFTSEKMKSTLEKVEGIIENYNFNLSFITIVGWTHRGSGG